MRFFWLMLALMLGVSSCHAPGLSTTRIQIAKDATFDLLPPADLKQSISLEQIVDARYGDKKFSFHCLLEVDAQHLVLVGMTPMNTRAFTLTLQGGELSVEMMPGAQLPAEPARILADLQLALWPIRRVNSTVEGLVLSESREPIDGGPPLVERRLGIDGKPVIRIRYDRERYLDTAPWSGTLLFENIEQDCTLVVRTLRAEILKP